MGKLISRARGRVGIIEAVCHRRRSEMSEYVSCLGALGILWF